jgi:hypothetical protein
MSPFENRQAAYSYYLPLVGSTMFELGGIASKTAEGKFLTFKDYFEGLGYRHVSVDMDGRFGALDRDLRKPLWSEFGQFDMVCNMGTSEHVTEQKPCWENIHNLTKVGGIYVGSTPYPDGKSWTWHGNHYVTEAFYESFADLNGWVIERMGRGDPIPHECLFVRMRKVEDLPFTMPNESLIVYNETNNPLVGMRT